MPINPELRPLYPPDWPDISHRIRFVRALGRCERCHRPHNWTVYCLPDGRWCDLLAGSWRSDTGDWVPSPTAGELAVRRAVLVMLTTAHLDHDPTNNDEANLAALCARCHLRHDLAHHLVNRRRTVRARFALGDLFPA